MKPTNLNISAQTYLTHYAEAIKTIHDNRLDEFPYPIQDIKQVTENLMAIINRNDKINKDLNSKRYTRIRDREKTLKGNCIIGAIVCVDDRIARVFFGREISVWKVPAGEITTQRRIRDNLRIPRSPSLRNGVKKAAGSPCEFLEFPIFHTDCAAMNSIASNFDSLESLNFKEKGRLSNQAELSLEDANAFLLAQTTTEAINNWYNIQRRLFKKPASENISIMTGYDIKTMSLFYRNYEQSDTVDLNSGVLVLKHQNLIEKLCGKKYALRKNNFTEPTHLLDLFEDIVEISEALINSDNDLKQEIDSYIYKYFPNLTPTKKKAVRWLLLRQVAMQYITGAATGNHPYNQHKKSPISISIRGEALGEFDTEQHFWSSPADSSNAIEQVNLQVAVGMGAKDNDGRPTPVFVCSSGDIKGSLEQDKGYDKTIENNELLLNSIVNDETIQGHLLHNRVVIVPITIDANTRLAIEIPDHSGGL